VAGASCKSGDWRQAYADYLVQYAKDYAAAGVPLTYVGPENETTIAPPQDGMIMSPAQTVNLMGILGATLARSGLSTLRGWSKPAWETEWAPFGFQPWDPAWDDGSPSSGFTWAQNIYTGLTAANLDAFLYLWGASTSSLTRDWLRSRATPSPPLAGCGRSRATAGSSARARCASARRRAPRAST
jgi:hypothetical protein